MAVPPAPDVEPVSGEHADEQHGSHDRSSTSPGFRLVLAVVLVLVLVGSLVSTGLLLASRTSAASGGLPGRVGALLSGENAVAAEREALSALLAGGVDRPGLDLAALGRMFTRLTERHTERMSELGLDA